MQNSCQKYLPESSETVSQKQTQGLAWIFPKCQYNKRQKKEKQAMSDGSNLGKKEIIKRPGDQLQSMLLDGGLG